MKRKFQTDGQEPTREKSTCPKREKRIILLLGIISVLLVISLGASLLYSYRERNRSVSVMAQVKKQQQIINEDMISIELFQQRSQQYSVGIPFLQSFFEDKIVYKNHTGVVYAPIDPALPKNNYDFNALSYQNGIAKYADKNQVVGKVGIDVSYHQGEIDWSKVKSAGISYAFLRAGYRGYDTGKLKEDEQFSAHLKEASEAEIDLGVYFYSQAISKEEAVEEANFVLEKIKGTRVDYPIVFDMEIESEKARTAKLTPAQITDITIAFCERIKEAGYTPMIYGNIIWMMDHLQLERVTGYQKWFAQYYNKPFFPYEFQIWQYSSTGKIPGIKGDVDLNLCFADYKATAKK